ETLKAMKENLLRDPDGTLKDFRARCLSAGDEKTTAEGTETAQAGARHSKMIPAEIFVSGLDFLSQIDLLKVEVPRDKKVILLQGKKDRILHHSGSEKMAERRGFKYLAIEEAGHALPIQHPDVIARALLGLSRS